jgi:hypothetical protein
MFSAVRLEIALAYSHVFVDVSVSTVPLDVLVCTLNAVSALLHPSTSGIAIKI